MYIARRKRRKGKNDELSALLQKTANSYQIMQPVHSIGQLCTLSICELLSINKAFPTTKKQHFFGFSLNTKQVTLFNQPYLKYISLCCTHLMGFSVAVTQESTYFLLSSSISTKTSFKSFLISSSTGQTFTRYSCLKTSCLLDSKYNFFVIFFFFLR